ncbi:DUF4236 domain-containing protein [Stenotrophomonas maltophilia]
MGFRFQRHIRLGGGWGLNASGSGASLSHRSRHGSVGTRGFSLRTGIPGLSFRQSWGKNTGVMALLVLCFVVLAAMVKVLLYLLPLLWQCLAWVVLTVYDLCRYGIQRVVALRTR